MKTKTFEEKSADYIRIKNRIFNNIEEPPIDNSINSNNNNNSCQVNTVAKQPQQQYTILNHQNSSKNFMNEPAKTFKPNNKLVSNKKPFVCDRSDKSAHFNNKNLNSEYFANNNNNNNNNSNNNFQSLQHQVKLINKIKNFYTFFFEYSQLSYVKIGFYNAKSTTATSTSRQFSKPEPAII